MNPDLIDPVRLGHFTFPASKQRLSDGRWIVTPGEPVMRCRTAETVRITGIPSKTLHKLADAGVIRRATVTPNIVYWWPAEIEDVIQRAAADDWFAHKVAFASSSKVEDLRPRA